MPLGIGRYSEHVKISTDYDEDDDPPDEDADTPHLVRYIGQQNIPLFNSRDISGVMYSIYTKNYSPLNSLINVKKYELHVDSSGIKVYANNNKKGVVPNDLFHSYLLPDVLLVSTDYQHDRLFAIIFYGSLRNCMIHLYLCNSEEDVRSLLAKCHAEFSRSRDIKLVEKSQYSDGLEIIHYKPYEKLNTVIPASSTASCLQSCDSLKTQHDAPAAMLKANGNVVGRTNENSCSSSKKENDPMAVDINNFRIPFGDVSTQRWQSNGHSNSATSSSNDVLNSHSDSFNFGDFQTAASTADVVLTIPLTPPAQKNPEQQQQQQQQQQEQPQNLLDDEDFEDEFAELALKRNIYVPDHLQDRSIESVLLVQDSATELTPREEQMKPGFFSSYNKLQ